MARTIQEIKESITNDFMNNEEVAAIYGFTRGDSFSTHFSGVTIEGLLFYIFAVAIYVQEQLFDVYRKEVEERIDQIIPHRAKWYRDKALEFLKGKLLIQDSDKYDMSGMSEDEITAIKVVSHAVALESEDASILTIKVRGENGRLDEETEKQLSVYLQEIKDAGVRISLVNLTPDTFHCEVDIYYNSLLLAENVQEDCREAIISYLQNLPFNGQYTNMDLLGVLQKIDGVKIAEVKSSSYAPDNTNISMSINAKCTPEAGYFQAGNIQINMIVYG